VGAEDPMDPSVMPAVLLSEVVGCSSRCQRRKGACNVLFAKQGND